MLRSNNFSDSEFTETSLIQYQISGVPVVDLLRF